MLQPPDRRQGRSSGFTIVELLVAIAIIALLIGLLLTGIRAARGAARETQQLNNARQMFVAWSTYAMQNDDACLPGFLDTDVQSAWKVKYRNASGQQIDPVLTQTYMWRLAGFLDYNTELVLGYLSRGDESFTNSIFEDGSLSFTLPASLTGAIALPGGAAALQPEFGYNAFYLGGWWEMEGNTPTMRFMGAKHPTTGTPVAPVARTTSTITRPENMVVFCGSTFSDPRLIKEVPEGTPGAAWVAPPYLASTQVWTIGPDGDANSIQVQSANAVPLRRFNSVVYGAADGSQSKASYRELWDMSRWTNRADLPEAERLQPVHTEN